MRIRERWLARIGATSTRMRYDERLREEIEGHLALQTAENLRAGMPAAEARRQAVLKFGAVEAIREQYQAEVASAWLQTLLQDLRYAVRMLAKSPGFATVACLTLALGVGAGTAIFSVVNAVLLRPLPYVNPGQLVSLSEGRPKDGTSGDGLSWDAYTALREHSRSFRAVAGLAIHALTLTGQGEPADMSTVSVTPDFFSLFRVNPLLGRTLMPEDGQDGAAPVAVLSEGLWRSRFGADPEIAGRAVTLDRRSYTIAGVMPANFRTPFVGQTEQVWIPLAQDPLFSGWRTRPQTTHWMAAFARLRNGVSIAAARAEAGNVGAGLAQQIPAENGWAIGIDPLQQVIVGDVKTPLLLLFGAVGLVLLIACANIANLLLTRATSRSREIAVRVALGASPRRIARQLLTESALLGWLGGAAGALLAWGSVKACASRLPAGLPEFHAVRVDGAVLGFALVLSVGASLLFGLAPVLGAARSDPQAHLREGARAGETRGSRHLRSALAVAEVALAVVLLAGAGLLLRSFAHLLAVNPGFESASLVKAEVSLPRFQYSGPEQWRAFTDQLMARLEGDRGLHDAALAVPLPILDNAVSLPFVIAGNAPLPPGKTLTADFVSASPQYFGVMDIPLLRGRVFSPGDTATTPPVALISETLARRYFPHESPLGRHLVFGFPPNNNVSREIVGVVADIHDVALAQKPGPMLYVPFAQQPFWGAEIVVKSRLGAAEVGGAIRAATHRLDPGVPVTNIETLPQAIEASVAEPRFRTVLLGLFGAIALLLAAVGLYGVVSFSVARRTREIGLRMALGATRVGIRRLVLGESARLVLAGLAGGIQASLILTHFLSTLLFGVKAFDPATYGCVAVLLTAVALVAAYIPARRAMRVDPMVALRCE
ncbi:MAG TPA: ABC transporter permease [Acidobacteriaceae bacterium]